MAFDEAYEAGWLNRRVEIVVHDENGLPFGRLRNAVEGFDWLVEQGCIAVAGAYSGVNAIALPSPQLLPVTSVPCPQVAGPLLVFSRLSRASSSHRAVGRLFPAERVKDNAYILPSAIFII